MTLRSDPSPPPASLRRKRRIGRAARVGLALVATALVLWLLHVPILISVARVLSVAEPPERADLIYQFGGGFVERTQHTAKLYHSGVAPRILLMRVHHEPHLEGLYPNETDLSVRILLRSGVPPSAIELYQTGDGVSSTTEEAAALAEVLRREGTGRVLAVTSWYHTRRARWALRRALRDSPVAIAMAGAPTVGWNAGNWWRREDGVMSILEEYLKFAHNWVYR